MLAANVHAFLSDMVDGAHASTNWQCSRRRKDRTILLIIQRNTKTIIFYGVENKCSTAKDKKGEKFVDKLAELEETSCP